MNINIEIPNELHKRLKLAALLHDQTLKEYLLAAFAEIVAQEAKR